MNRALSITLAVVGAAASGIASGSVTFYESENFDGRTLTINQTLSNLGGTGFNDRARSAIISKGRWEVCADAEFAGACQVLGPGRYANLGALGGRVSSIRPASDPVAAMPDRRGGGRRASGEASATLYEGRNLSGRSFAINGQTMPNLGATGFNDRASSLRVESGYWLFCSDANFSGECRTFGPGNYASLPAGLNDVISSGRRISNDYPYKQKPSWQR